MTGGSHRLELSNDLGEIGRLAEFVESFCAPLKASPEDELALQLSLEEAVTNVIRHGYRDGQAHRFAVTLEAGPHGLVRAVVADDAPAFDPLSRPPVDTSVPLEDRPIGGLGVHLVMKLMDSARYERRGGHNVLTLERAFGRAR